MHKIANGMSVEDRTKVSLSLFIASWVNLTAAALSRGGMKTGRESFDCIARVQQNIRL